MKQAVLLLSIALCVCAAAAAQNAVSTSSLIDSIITPKASTMSGYRYGVERESMCFHTASICTVEDDNPVTFKRGFSIDDIQCGPCPELHHGGDYYGSRHNDDGSFIAEVTPTLSKCIVTPDYLVAPVPLTLKPTWSYAGTYTAMCFLEDDSKAGCKFPDTCEDTVVAIQGLIYEVPAIRLGAASPVVENSAVKGECGPPVRRRAAGKAAEKPAGAAAPKVPTGKASVQSKGYSEPETMVKLGRALVLSGTGTVHAGHVLKYKTVHHQYSDFTPTLADGGDFTDKALSELGPDVMKLGDRVHKFDFVGEPKAHY